MLGGAMVGDFWAWAYSDVLNNTTRAVLAEFIVGTALDAVGGVRMEWEPFDLLYGGVGVEVKSSAYVQRWEQKGPSAISWGIEERLSFDSATNTLSPKKGRRADCYVFCLYSETDRDHANVLDVAKWTFYVLSTEEINRRLGTQKRVSLSTIERMTGPVGYAALRERVDSVLKGEQFPAADATTTAVSVKRRRLLSRAKLREAAERNGVEDTYRLLLDGLTPLFDRTKTTLRSVGFEGRAGGGYRVIFNLVPTESSVAEGLRFEAYLKRLSEHLGVGEEDAAALLPSSKKPWEYTSGADPNWSGFAGFFRTREEAKGFVRNLRELKEAKRATPPRYPE